MERQSKDQKHMGVPTVIVSCVGSTVHAVNSNRAQILGKIRLDWFVIFLNLGIGFLRVKSGFLKGQVSPSI